MNDLLLLNAAAWGLFPFLTAVRMEKYRWAWGWAAASFAAAAAGLIAGGRDSVLAAGGLAAAWISAGAILAYFTSARRRAAVRFRIQLKELRRPAHRAEAEAEAQFAVLESYQSSLDRMQNRFALVQTMATQMDTVEILRSLGEMWSGIPHVRRCALFQRLRNGNWSPAFSHGIEKPETWASFVNDRPSLADARRTRRFISTDRHAELSALGAGTPFLLLPFVWGEDVMALGAVELDAAATEDILEGFHVERKLVSIGLRRAFLYDLMSERSRHDGLTGVLLRRTFLERLEESLGKRQRYHTTFFLALFDLDRFKTLNDRFGHLAGDRALVHVARTAQRLAVPGVTLGRLGGDEFAFLLEFPILDEARAWVEKFRAEVRDHAPVEGNAALPVSVSLGLAEAPLERISVEQILERADQALFAAKQAGRDRTAVFSEV
jgi:diguanylate cyclase (GGDEF)-like protein